MHRLRPLLVAASLLVGSVSPVPAGADAIDHLVLVLTDRVEPTELVVRPGERIVWLNRTSGSMIAITFETPFPGAPPACAIARAFHPIDATATFTHLLAPGSVAALCAPGPGTYRYFVSGDVAIAGLLRVVGAP